MNKHKYDKVYVALTVIIIAAVAVLIWYNN